MLVLFWVLFVKASDRMWQDNDLEKKLVGTESMILSFILLGITNILVGSYAAACLVIYPIWQSYQIRKKTKRKLDKEKFFKELKDYAYIKTHKMG